MVPYLQPTPMNTTQCRKQKVQPRIMAENLQQQEKLCAYIWIHVKHFYYICSNQFRLILQVIFGKIEKRLLFYSACIVVELGQNRAVLLFLLFSSRFLSLAFSFSIFIVFCLLWVCIVFIPLNPKCRDSPIFHLTALLTSESWYATNFLQLKQLYLNQFTMKNWFSFDDTAFEVIKSLRSTEYSDAMPWNICTWAAN